MRYEVSGNKAIKYRNILNVYETIRQKQGISRIDLSAETGMSATSMTRLCTELIEAGLITEGSSSASTVGRKAVLLNVCKDASYGFCIHIDVGTVKFAIYDMLLNLLSYKEMPAGEETDYYCIIDSAKKLMHSMAQDSGIETEDIRAVGISSVGSVEKGIMRYVAQFRWSMIPAVEYAEKVFSLPVILENDSKSALIGERHKHFSAKPPSNIAYITFLKRGVGSAAIINGQLLRGANNAAGEIGHTTIAPDGRMCDCGRKGCLQTFLAADFIVEEARAIVPSIETIHDLFIQAQAGNLQLQAIIDRMHKYASIAINLVACTYNPDIIIINDYYFMNRYTNYVRNSNDDLLSYVFQAINDKVVVEGSALGSSASLYGIGCVLQEVLFSLKLKSK